MAACWTVAHAAPPPWWILEKNFRSPTPVARAMATSVLESIVKVTMPSTSLGVRPASSSASRTASAASRSSLRPEFFEKSVAPMPTIAAFPESSPTIRTSDGQRRIRDDVIAKAVAANDFQRDQPAIDCGYLALERHRVVGVPRHTQSQPDRLDQRRRAGPVGDVALHQAGVGENVDEDVLGPLGLRLVPVVVDVLVVTGGDRRRDDERRVAVQRQLRQLRADLYRRGAHASGSHAYNVQAGPMSLAGKSIYVALTGIPTSTVAGSTLRSSPSIRTPSSSCTSAMTNGSVRPGTFGA